MDSSAPAPLPIRPAPLRRDSSNKFTRPGDKERYEYEKAKAANKGKWYKEKFHQLREKYDQVNATNDHYRRDLDRANEKMKALQAEMDLLLDAMSIALPSEPALERFYNEPLAGSYSPPAPPHAHPHSLSYAHHPIHGPNPNPNPNHDVPPLDMVPPANGYRPHPHPNPSPSMNGHGHHGHGHGGHPESEQ